MKSVMLIFAVVIVVGLLTSNVECASMGNCPPCNSSECPEIECACGSHKDMCNCCDFCNKCPNEDCSLIENDVCSPGHTCTYPEGADFMYVNQNYGKCLPSKNH